MATIAEHFHGWFALGTHAVVTPAFWLAVAGVVAAWYCYMVNPRLPEAIKASAGGLYRLLDNKYYMDRINEVVFAGGARLLGRGLWKGGDQALIDGRAYTGSGKRVAW